MSGRTEHLYQDKLAGKPFNSKFQPFFSGSMLSFYNMTACLGTKKYAQDRLNYSCSIARAWKNSSVPVFSPGLSLDKAGTLNFT